MTLGSAYGGLVAVAEGVCEGQLAVTGNLLKVPPDVVVAPLAPSQHATPPPGRR